MKLDTDLSKINWLSNETYRINTHVEKKEGAERQSDIYICEQPLVNCIIIKNNACLFYLKIIR